MANKTLYLLVTLGLIMSACGNNKQGNATDMGREHTKGKEGAGDNETYQGHESVQSEEHSSPSVEPKNTTAGLNGTGVNNASRTETQGQANASGEEGHLALVGRGLFPLGEGRPCCGIGLGHVLLRGIRDGGVHLSG